MSWFEEARFGMFVHWGPYTVAARGEWVMNRERIPLSEYAEKYAARWKAEHYDPAAWCALAREAGMEYIVLTTRHHDGFALWDTATTDWNAARLGPGRDLVGPFVEAARAAGLRIGFYYSGADWSHPDYPGPFYRDWPQKEDWASEEARQRFFAFYREQLRELMTQYGQIDILWYDGCLPGPFDGAAANAMVRQLQPGILINERNGEPCDFRISEQTVNPKPGPWEACMTLNDNWGWHAGDAHWKTSREVIHLLVQCAGQGGNLLLNMGPMPDGRMPEPAERILRETGKWLARNRAFLPRSERHGLGWNNTCQITARDHFLYLHFHHQPGPEFCLAELQNRVRSARLLVSGQSVAFTQKDDRLFLTGLPVPLPDSPVTVIELELDGPPKPLQKTVNHWIPN
jgi:alpha-L-fucosidase